MAKNRIGSLLLLLLLVSVSAVDATLRRKRKHGNNWFLLDHSKTVVKTEAGEMRLVRSRGEKFVQSSIHIGFISMNPRTLFTPQYIDSSIILFVHHECLSRQVNTGEALVAHIHREELVERSLRTGDIYRIEPGSAFYIVNYEDDQKLDIICSIDTSQSLGWNSIQSFFIAGGTYPISILSGFDHQTLSAAFNVSESELGSILTKQQRGPIVRLPDSELKRNADLRQKQKWSFKRLAFSSSFPESLNIYEQKPEFENSYGSTTTVNESEYPPLSQDDISVFLVNLSAGSMTAPHLNPRAAVYGVVLRGSGRLQIVHPNGTLALNADISEGDVFWVPRYYPYSEIASGESSLELFGFTTSSRNNRPQFLAGKNSLLQSLRGSELAVAFGVSSDRLNEIIDAQQEEVILPAAPLPEVASE